MAYTIRLNTSRVNKAFKGAEKQIPFVIAKAVTLTSKQTRDHINVEIPDIFKHANAFTRNATAFAPANKKDLTGRVFIKDAQARYLQFEELGGTRTPSDGTGGKSSKAIVIAGKKNPTKTASGALPKRYLAKLAEKIQKQAMPQTKKSKAKPKIIKTTNKGPMGGPGGFFLETPGKDKTHLTRLVSFVSQATYTPKFKFRQRVNNFAKKAIKENIQTAITQTLRTMK